MRRNRRRLVIHSVAALVTLAVTSFLTLGFMLLPDLPLLGKVIAEGTQVPDQAALDPLAAEFRIALQEQYFSWAVVSIAIGGVTVWRHALSGLSLYVRTVLAMGFVLSSLSIILGVGYMDYVATGMAIGFMVLRDGGVVGIYPTIQFFCLVNGFMLLGFAALLTTLKRANSCDEGAS